MDSLPLVFSSGWASGVNAYLVVLVLGVADRVNPTESIPDVLARWDVLGVAFFLFAMEFVADKIPYIDSTWDAISTAIRPTSGAVIGVLMAGDATTLDQAVLGVVGGGTALLSHLVKAGSRLAINSSPEPVTNIGASLAEDVTVFFLVVVRHRAPEGRRGHRRRAAGGRADGAVLRGAARPTRLAAVEEASRPDAHPRAARSMIDTAATTQNHSIAVRRRPWSSRRTTGPAST